MMKLTYAHVCSSVQAIITKIPQIGWLKPQTFIVHSSECWKVQNQGLAAKYWWLTPVILAQEAEIRRISVRSQPGQIVLKTLS
jgi:hypothetical protein